MAALKASRSFGSEASLATAGFSDILQLRDTQDVKAGLAGSRDRLAKSLGGGQNKKKMGSLNNLSANRESVAVGQLKLRNIYRESSEIYTVKFSHDDEYVASGLGDGRIPILSTRTHDLLHILPAPPDARLPVTCIAYRPDNSAYKNRNVLVAAYASGHVVHWHTTSGQVMSTIIETENQVNSVVYDNYGTRLATGGSDQMIRVYDGMGMKEITAMHQGTPGVPIETAGHSNRIFSLRFHPTDPHCLISGGWDNTIQLWDIRVGHSVRSIYGPHICGDSLDISDNGEKILTGSWKKDDNLQVWSLKTGTLIETLAWSVAEGEAKQHTMLYSAQYSRKGNGYIVAGGGGMHNQVKIFSAASRRPVGMVHTLPSTVYSVAMSNSTKMVAFGGADKTLHMYDMDPHGLTDFVY
ncbi:WD40-repeat-containing domain protein [Phlyctochytrium arcticum]|nr:WD40-repeat-containing domain protein [Phlyctochytrium arcticum]